MNKKYSFMTIVSLLSLFLLNSGIVTINPAIQKIMEAFPNIPFTTILLVSTLPSLFAVPAALISGIFVGSKIRYKTLAIIGVLLFIVAGVAPAYMIASSFVMILITRALFGVAFGIILPLGNAILLGLFEGQQKVSILGISNVFVNIGGIVLQFLGGYLAIFGWNYAFYGHAVAILTLILIILFLPEPEKAPQSSGGAKQKIRIPAGLWLIYIVYSISLVLLNPIMLNLSSMLSIKALGGSTTAALVLSFFTVGGMAGAAVFSTFFKYTKKYIVAIALFFFAIGQAGVVYGWNIIIVTIGMGLAGFGMFIMFPSIIMIISGRVAGNAIPMSMSILMSIVNLAVFASTYYIGLVGKLTGDAFINPTLIAMGIYALCAIVFLFINPFPKPKEVSTNK